MFKFTTTISVLSTYSPRKMFNNSFQNMANPSACFCRDLNVKEINNYYQYSDNFNLSVLHTLSVAT